MDETPDDAGGGRSDSATTIVIDLRGVRCPISWARARVQLEGVPRGGEAELIVDDPKGARDIPRAAEASGYVVVAVEAAGGAWRIRLAV